MLIENKLYTFIKLTRTYDVNTAVFFNSILDFTMYNMKFQVIHINVKRYLHRHRSAHIAIIPAICFMNMVHKTSLPPSFELQYLHQARNMSALTYIYYEYQVCLRFDDFQIVFLRGRNALVR
jgi:hypothetical protein